MASSKRKSRFSNGTGQWRKWIEPSVIQVPDDVAGAVGGDPLVARTIFRRGCTDATSAIAFLNPDHYTPTPPSELTDLVKAADFLEQAVTEGKYIGVWGDFDVDGLTATTLLVSTLQKLGGRVAYHIPVRAGESHGLNIKGLERLLQQQIDVLVTCDTGTSAIEEINYVQSKGVPVIVTDHHDLPINEGNQIEIPQAFAVINPKRLPEGHNLSTLPGVGVAYKLVEELCNRANQGVISEAMLDLVALGIEADLASQIKETRYLLQRGLAALRNTQRLGLWVLMEYAELNPQNLTEEHIGFVIAPRLNALGRLADANWIVEFLTTDDLSRARILASTLEGLNAQRKLLTDQIFQAAIAQIEVDPSLLDEPALVLSHPTWPSGVIGIVANRLVERFDRPVVLFSSPPGQLARGSGRSVEGINITAAIAANQHLLNGYGGHPMAAGLSLKAEQIPEFKRAFCRTIGQQAQVIPIATLPIDAYLPLSSLSLELVSDLERLAPFGPGNPSLTLATRDLNLTAYTGVGRNNEHLLLTVEDDTGYAQRVIWWQAGDNAQEGRTSAPSPTLPQGRFDLAYSVRASTYRGQKDVQVEWIDFRLSQESRLSISTPEPEIEAVDYRGNDLLYPDNKPASLILNNLVTLVSKDRPAIATTEFNLQIWNEAEPPPVTSESVFVTDRYGLMPGLDLIIWTIPPGSVELRKVLEKVSPQRVYLFATNPHIDRPDVFLKRLAGLIKYALHNQQLPGVQVPGTQVKVHLSSLAALTSHRIQTVRVGLLWLAHKGHIIIYNSEGDEWIIGEGNGLHTDQSKETARQLRSLLDETAAYRAFYTRADKNSLIVASDAGRKS